MSAFSEERVLSRPPLDRPPVHLHHHARPGAALLQRPLHDDRPAGQQQAAAARLQHRQRQLRGAPRVPQHQGATKARSPRGCSTSRSGDTIIVGRKPTGTLLIDYLLPGKRLYLLGTGTGLAPFMSIIRDPETYEKFEQVILVHGVRQVDELAYHDLLIEHLPKHEFLGEMVDAAAALLPDRDARGVPQHGPHHRADRDRQADRRPRPAAARRRPKTA